MTAALAYRIRELLLSILKLLRELGIGTGLFKRIEIGALDILDQRHFQGFAV